MSADQPLIRDTRRIAGFRKRVYRFYATNGRKLPWRKTNDPYKIVVSEVMLQQTQVPRVITKYREFIRAFPTARALSRAAFSDILKVWQGMGYNRRALLLKRLAAEIVGKYKGVVPRDTEALVALPGIGYATSQSIRAFAFNEPVVFIETNIRSVFIHEFFHGRADVSDSELLPLVAAALDRNDPCRWYNALMDYGVRLKEKYGNPSRRSKHYVKQPPFKGSDRQIRGKILRACLAKGPMTEKGIIKAVQVERERTKKILAGMRAEGLITRTKTRYALS